MDFNKYMLEVWRPMQQQALARGMNPKDVDMRSSMINYIGPRLVDQAKTDAANKKFELENKRLGLKSRAIGIDERRASEEGRVFQRGKRLAPWAIGLDVANVGVSGLQDLNQRNQARIDRQTMLRNFDEYQRSQYKRRR